MLDQYASPEEGGRIYAQIAHVYAHAGVKEANKTVEYCEKALENPLDVATKLLMYETWASTLHTVCARQGGKWPESSWNEFPEVRREIVTLRLRAIKAILDQGTPAKKQPLPMVGKFRCRRVDSPRCLELVKKHKEQMRARSKVMFENDLVFRREILTGQCVYIYSQKPVDTAELAALAREILSDEDAVSELLAQLASRIKDKAETDPMKRDD